MTTSEIVREKDSAAKSAPDHAKLVGMTLNPNWNEKLLPMKKGKALMPPPPPPPLSAAASGDSKVKEKTKTKDTKPKPGTLDWGKARVKTKEEPKPDKEDTKVCRLKFQATTRLPDLTRTCYWDLVPSNTLRSAD